MKFRIPFFSKKEAVNPFLYSVLDTVPEAKIKPLPEETEQNVQPLDDEELRALFSAEHSELMPEEAPRISTFANVESESEKYFKENPVAPAPAEAPKTQGPYFPSEVFNPNIYQTQHGR